MKTYQEQVELLDLLMHAASEMQQEDFVKVILNDPNITEAVFNALSDRISYMIQQGMFDDVNTEEQAAKAILRLE